MTWLLKVLSPMQSKAFLNWSSGKDAMLALHRLQTSADYTVDKLLTTANAQFNRVSMHGVREELVQQQAKALGIPLQLIHLDHRASMTQYNQVMRAELQHLKSEGFTHSVFGDILLEDLKAYREKQLEEVNVEAVFPLWKSDTKQLLTEFITLGYQAIVVCVNANYLDQSFCGRIIDEQFIADLPDNVDPCGENGEFHSFVFDGPLFAQPVKFKVGETVAKRYTSSGENKQDCHTAPRAWDIDFWFTDLQALS